MDTTILNLIAGAAAAGAAACATVAGLRVRTAEAALDDDGETLEVAADDAGDGLLRRLAAPIAVHLRPTRADELELLTTRLLTAGRRSRGAVDRYAEERVLALLGGLAAVLAWSAMVGGGVGALLSLVSVVVGIVGPSQRLAARATARRDAFAAALPGAVDLLTTCIDAGLSLEQALARVAREQGDSTPVLAEELRITARELDAGVALPDALRRLARRVGLDELSALCGVIAQAHGLGAPVGATLREFAEASRRSRMSQLEERAGKLAAQLTLPLATCLLPASMLVIIGPAVLQLVRALH